MLSLYVNYISITSLIFKKQNISIYTYFKCPERYTQNYKTVVFQRWYSKYLTIGNYKHQPVRTDGGHEQLVQQMRCVLAQENNSYQ